jgi:hypothetical protein
MPCKARYIALESVGRYFNYHLNHCKMLAENTWDKRKDFLLREGEEKRLPPRPD